MAAIEPNGIALALFAASFAACCLGFFTLVGMFPPSARPQAVAGAAGSALVLFNVVLCVLLLAGVALFVEQRLRWTSAVIFGGLILLFIPSIFQIVPNERRDSRSGLAVLGLVQIASLLLLVSSAVGLSL
ncbi:hypothetical protein [Bradyrhizobium sp. ARR65]|uniref:hypothetical protein n=1 Tax=Bradyrhizobium sp. ARR65 TaxID=1040989 RepID=UPI0004653994|nr:hypothetical protein [Bradyrhizobium sp. ARR65]